MPNVHHRKVGDGYFATNSWTYTSPRYGKSVTIPEGMWSDGVTCRIAIDIPSDSWWVHDALCRYGAWDDGTRCTNWQASTVLHDIMQAEGFWVRAPIWRIATWLFGGGAARAGKIYERES